MTRSILVCSLLLAVGANAQTPAGLKHLPSGIDYKIVKDAPGNPGKKGEFIFIHFVTKANGKELQDSRVANNGSPLSAPISDPQFAGDPMEVINMLSKGDSAIIVYPADSLRKRGIQIPEEYKMMEMYVSVADIKSEAQVKEEAANAAAAQVAADDKLIQDYLKKNNIKAQKTASGLYYKIDAPGEGEVIKNGQTADVMYIGKLLNGTVFDANFGPDAKHTDPIQVPVGGGRVIKGWDEGLALLKKGSKATFYIPSNLAYGAQSPSPAIPANSVLVFDVEIKDVK